MVIEADGPRDDVPLLSGRRRSTAAPAAYVCRGFVCERPVTTVEAFRRRLPGSRFGPCRLTTYDYVIVGAGSAGAVLAARLSEDPGTSVLLLEAGGEADADEVMIPAAFASLFKTRWDWNYSTTEQKQLHGRRAYWPRMKALGGCSSMNAMIYIRGNRADYDAWRDQYGADGWAFDDVLPYFVKAERNSRLGAPLHGQDGPLHVEDRVYTHPLSHAFVDSAVSAGHKPTDDFNGVTQEGAGLYQVTCRKGRRWSTNEAYLKPARSRSNLTVETGALAARVELEGSTRATGVTFRQGGAEHTVRATREVLLCGGSINSPQLLLLSGIGPSSHLGEVGVETRVDLAGVGANLQDHPVVPMLWHTHGITDLAQLNNVRNFARWKLRGTGPLASNIGEAGAFFASRDGLPAPDVQIHMAPAGFYDNGLHEPTHAMVTAAPTLVSVASRGHLRLRSADPTWHPEIEAAYFDDQADLDAMLAGLRRTFEICTQGALAAYVDRPWELPDGPVRRRPRRARAQVGPDPLPPDLDVRDGLGRGRRGRPAAAGARCRGAAGRRRLRHAGRPARQHQRTHDHDRREGRRPHQGDPMTATSDRTADRDDVRVAQPTHRRRRRHPPGQHAPKRCRPRSTAPRRKPRWWGALSFDEREKHLQTWKGAMTRRLAQLAEVMHQETGKPHGDAMLEAALAIDHLAWAASHAEKVLKRRKVSSGLVMANQAAYVEYQPLGVIGVIGPWNYPVFTPMGSIGYALAAGNAVVFKPSEYTPGVGEWLARTFLESVGRPVLQVVTGFGETGHALCTRRGRQDRVHRLHRDRQEGDGRVRRDADAVVIEAGGKDALLVDEDADLEAAADAAIWGACSNAGQTCAGVERVYVHERVYDEFLTTPDRQGARGDRRTRGRTPRSGRSRCPSSWTSSSGTSTTRSRVAAGPWSAAPTPWASGSCSRPSWSTSRRTREAVQEETFGPTVTVAQGARHGRGGRARQRHPLRPRLDGLLEGARHGAGLPASARG